MLLSLVDRRPFFSRTTTLITGPRGIGGPADHQSRYRLVKGSNKYIFLSFILITIAITSSKGEIKNGYAPRIAEMRESLKALNALLDEDIGLSLFKRSDMQTKIRKLIDYIAYFELTEELLNQFKSIAPDMYNEINSITDITGRPVTVFVKFVPETEIMRGAGGTTNIAHTEGNKDIYESEYGPRTVSVRIASVTKSLILLAHEFGHVKYQIPNLAKYFEFYSVHYQRNNFNSKYIGHNSNDLSGQAANEYENQFRARYVNYIKTSSTRPANPLVLLNKFQKTLNN